MRTYHFSLEYVTGQLPVIQGLALLAGASATEPMVDAEIEDGYIAQEIRRRRNLK